MSAEYKDIATKSARHIYYPLRPLKFFVNFFSEFGTHQHLSIAFERS